ncbi:uncharacterized protein LOC132645134 isoform X3 [Lycium barbarum]|uniref:uncharacterized protein LOC132645134 isoform X3 n=1 Tax=Lycium barbarum TaxID=112863 RepID=UPI00293E7968|nr:uncharacterized protein LOC132645134 isoform X3 [Lycium barbarum]
MTKVISSLHVAFLNINPEESTLSIFAQISSSSIWLLKIIVVLSNLSQISWLKEQDELIVREQQLHSAREEISQALYEENWLDLFAVE